VIAGLFLRSRSSATDVAKVAVDLQKISESLHITIPDIARRATRADMREYPRYDIEVNARIEGDGGSYDARVFDISESGARIESLPGYAIGSQIALTIPGLHPVTGRVVRAADSSFGVCFEPQKLKTEEVRRLIVAAAAA
jgi:hypothetical protein